MGAAAMLPPFNIMSGLAAKNAGVQNTRSARLADLY